MMESLGVETQNNKAMEATTLSLARPHRKRKAVNRFPIEQIQSRVTTTKILVLQGNGTPLKDIPNVAFKLSKQKTDNNLVLLHTILFGKKAKVQTVKKNLGLFSGFLWVEEEEKQRLKVRKKIDQCVKAKLLDFCNILDIPVNKATVKKEDLAAMLLKFLESPHPTTEILLADKQKTRNSRGGAKQQQSKVKEEEKRSESSIYEDYPQEESDDEKGNDSGDREDEKVPHLGKLTAVRKIYVKEFEISKTQVEGHPAKSTNPSSRKRSSCSSSKEVTSGVETESKFFVDKKPKIDNKRNKISEADAETKSSVKKSNIEKEQNKGQNASVRKPSSKLNASTRSPPKAKTIDQGKTRKKKAEVTGEEMQTVLTHILKKVDLNTATFSDIRGQLGAFFNMDLSHRKAEVKALITDIINKMMDEDEEPNTGKDTDNEDDNDTYYN